MPKRNQPTSRYKIDFFHHPAPKISKLLKGSNDDVEAYKKIVDHLQTNELLNKHELSYFIYALKIISDLDDENCFKIPLRNAAYCQLVKYTTACINSSLVCMITIDLFNANPVAALQGLSLILLTESINQDVQKSLKKYKPFIIQLPSPSNWSQLAKDAVSNSYEFVKSNANFFYHKTAASSLPNVEEQDVHREVKF